MSVRRNNNEQSREFWEGVDRSAAEVAKWPAWKIDRPNEVCTDDAARRASIMQQESEGGSSGAPFSPSGSGGEDET